MNHTAIPLVGETQPRLYIIVASTRPGRVGLPIGQWVYERALAQGDFVPELIDLAEVGLPFMDEPHHPRFGNYVHQHTKDWSAKIEAADAFIFVTPEYNHGMSAPLKNALDYLHREWQFKPVGFVSYGGVAAGTRAVQMIKQVVASLKMMPLVEAVPIAFVNQFFDDAQQFRPNDQTESALATMLNELARVGTALRALRESAMLPVGVAR
jgi:NAD(P)H-dependent FMN reductase